MKRPWMPLYVADYLVDTAHFSALEHGAYLLLIMHYWSTGALPDDERLLARIAKLTPQQWQKARTIIHPLFHSGWKHKRIDFELDEAERLSAAGRSGGLASGRSRRKSMINQEADSTAVEQSLNGKRTMCEAPHPHPPSQLKKDLSNGGRERGEHQRPPPKHGQISRKHGTIFIRRDGADWDSYVADLRERSPFVDPIPNRDGGYWFPHPEAKRAN